MGRSRIASRIGDASSQRLQRRIDFALLAARRDARHHLPDIALGLVVVATIAHHGHAPDQVPGEQLLQGVRHVRARHAEVSAISSAVSGRSER